ncbi:L,D-transpeptidase [Lactococcus lactis]|uniref:L,D-transpeptidase n=1 Tax=Lactococcus lactis TaxID=1358 RepID=UPI0030F45ADA
MRPMTGNYWQYSSELGSYPALKNYNHLSIEVNISKNRTYLKSNNQVIYTFYSSAGVNNTTPSGNYSTQAETSPHFYNAGEGEGANFAISWKDHGVYLFHSVPVDGNGNYIVSEANKLGKSPSSHGCIRLSISDSNWLYNQALSGTLPVGTPVSIIR